MGSHQHLPHRESARTGRAESGLAQESLDNVGDSACVRTVRGRRQQETATLEAASKGCWAGIGAKELENMGMQITIKNPSATLPLQQMRELQTVGLKLHITFLHVIPN